MSKATCDKDGDFLWTATNKKTVRVEKEENIRIRPKSDVF
jgi:hypothetical protein